MTSNEQGELPAPQDGSEVIHSLFARQVIRTKARDRVIKSGPDIQENEIKTLEFIAANTTIPVPRVYEVHWRDDGTISSFVMDYMPGTPLDKVWDKLQPEKKLCIANELRDYIAQIRALEGGGGNYIGGLDRGKAYIGKRDFFPGGPFDREEEFNKFILNDLVSTVPPLLRHILSHGLYLGHKIVFTHSDIAPRNILVEDGHITAILDWEYAGWYPEHWEYMRAFRTMSSRDDWVDYLSIALPPAYEKEYVGMMAINLLVRH